MAKESEQSAATTSTPPREETRSEQQPKKLPPYHVVLLDDDDHTYDYVIGMMMKLFAHPMEKAYELAKEVDTNGRVIVLTTTKEHAELKRDQIHAFGPDVLIARCKGSMTALIEPAEE